MIRPATADDIEGIVRLGERYLEDMFFKDSLPFYPPSFRATVEWYVFHACALVMDTGDVSGFLLGAITPVMWNASLAMGQQSLWYVAPEHRGGESILMLEAFEKWCKDRGAVVLASGCKYKDRLGVLLSRKGYEPVETQYIRRT